jgi:hypothetical protein
MANFRIEVSDADGLVWLIYERDSNGGMLNLGGGDDAPPKRGLELRGTGSEAIALAPGAPAGRARPGTSARAVFADEPALAVWRERRSFSVNELAPRVGRLQLRSERESATSASPIYERLHRRWNPPLRASAVPPRFRMGIRNVLSPEHQEEFI